MYTYSNTCTHTDIVCIVIHVYTHIVLHVQYIYRYSITCTYTDIVLHVHIQI